MEADEVESLRRAHRSRRGFRGPPIEPAVVDQDARGYLWLCHCDGGGCDDQQRAGDSQCDFDFIDMPFSRASVVALPPAVEPARLSSSRRRRDGS